MPKYKATKQKKLVKQAKKLPKQPKKQSKTAKPTKRAKLSKQTKQEKKRAKAAKQAKPMKLAKKLKRTKKKEAKQAKQPEQERASARSKKSDGGKGRGSLSEVTRLPMASPNMRIGLLGGSFNPPHEAHVEISLAALKRLNLDQVWWLVTPGNPLKDASTLPSLETRVAAVKELAKHPRIAVTGFEGKKGSPYTIDLLAELKCRFPTVNFVWLMGADNLVSFHRWRAWEQIFGLMPIAVLDRPGFRLKARASKAAQRFSDYHIDESDAGGLARLEPPAWTILSHRLSSLSSTALRAKKPKKEKGKGNDRKGKKKRNRH